MPDRYPHFWGGSQICGQSAPPVKGTNGKKLKMLNCKFACISDPAANTMKTPVDDLQSRNGRKQTPSEIEEKKTMEIRPKSLF